MIDLTIVPEALESRFESGPFFVVLRETDGGRWFRTSGWELALGEGPTWSLSLGSPDLHGDLTALRYADWKLIFMEQKAYATMRAWIEPWTPLRVPLRIQVNNKHRKQPPRGPGRSLAGNRPPRLKIRRAGGPAEQLVCVRGSRERLGLGVVRQRAAEAIRGVGRIHLAGIGQMAFHVFE